MRSFCRPSLHTTDADAAGSARLRSRSLAVVAVVATTAATCLCLPGKATAQVSVTGLSFTQNFDTLPTANNQNTSVSWTDNSTLVGWYGTALPQGQGFTMNVTNGSANNKGLQDYGTISDTDRALGILTQGSGDVEKIAVRLHNDTNQVISSFNISFRGEQWRTSSNGGLSTMSFDFGLFASDGTNHLLDTVGYTTSAGTAGLTFNSPTNPTAGGPHALDGNAAANSAALSGTITNVNWQPGQDLWLRWTNNNAGGADSGLAIDTLSVAFQPVPAPPALTSLGIGSVMGIAQFGMIRLRRRRRTAKAEQEQQDA